MENYDVAEITVPAALIKAYEEQIAYLKNRVERQENYIESREKHIEWLQAMWDNATEYAKAVEKQQEAWIDKYWAVETLRKEWEEKYWELKTTQGGNHHEK